jgi:hypothetical protein
MISRRLIAFLKIMFQIVHFEIFIFKLQIQTNAHFFQAPLTLIDITCLTSAMQNAVIT